MNYRHRYHAGNPADVFKHAVLMGLIAHLRRKPKPMTIFDTHAGVGVYDLHGLEARRTAESDAGIGRLLAGPGDPALAGYLDLVRTVSLDAGASAGRLYPGSPEIIRRMMGPDDRLVVFELHPEDIIDLRRSMAKDPRVSCHHRDAYEGLPALAPPTPRRGLALIDPPFERVDEFAAALRCVAAVHRKWPVGVIALWYPIKGRPAVDAFLGDLVQSGVTGVLSCELTWFPTEGPAADTTRLNGSGMVVINAPFGLDDSLFPVLDALTRALTPDDKGDQPRQSIRWLAPRP